MTRNMFYRLFCYVTFLGIGFFIPAIQAKPLPLLDNKNNDVSVLSLENLQLFVEVLQTIKLSYVDPIDDEKLIQYAIEGMVNRLDKHSKFLLSEQLETWKEITVGKFAGIGVELDIQDHHIYISHVFPNTPASKSRLQPGDEIIQLDDVLIKNVSKEEIAKKMRGEEGSKVTLVVQRKEVKKPLRFVVTRAMIQLNSVEASYMEDGIGYVKISQFTQNTAQEVRHSIEELASETKLKGLILDLRNNPGGVLQAAVDISDFFLDTGKIVSIQGRIEGYNITFNAHQKMLVKNIPLVVLINKFSASASEIVAGALQDHKRAVIIGTNSFGKGTVQTILPLFSKEETLGLKLTTARYYTPSGRSIQSKGIIPDVEVTIPKKTENTKVDEQNKHVNDPQFQKALLILKTHKTKEHMARHH